MNRPGVSIVVISHNEERNIRDCLNSLDALTYPHDLIEVIVVDSSTDRTKFMVREFPGVRLVLLREKGFSPKRNVGFRLARHDLVAFVDADCMVPPDWLDFMILKMSGRWVAAVACDVFPPPDATFWGKLTACLGRPSGGSIGFDSMVNRREQGIDMVGTGHTIFRKDVLEEVGAFDENNRYQFGGEDVDISQRILKAGYILEYEDRTYIYHKCRDMAGFFRWSFRYGKSIYMLSQKSLWKLIVDPFSLVWPILMIMFLLVLDFRYSIVILIAFSIFALPVLIFPEYFFKRGGKQLKLLIKRRERIDISILYIYVLVVPLYYLDRSTMNLAQVYCALNHHKEKN